MDRRKRRGLTARSSVPASEVYLDSSFWSFINFLSNSFREDRDKRRGNMTKKRDIYFHHTFISPLPSLVHPFLHLGSVPQLRDEPRERTGNDKEENQHLD